MAMCFDDYEPCDPWADEQDTFGQDDDTVGEYDDDAAVTEWYEQRQIQDDIDWDDHDRRSLMEERIADRIAEHRHEMDID
jgi:hypothetical protein